MRQGNSNSHEELTIYQRKVEWSPVPQLRSSVETEFTPTDIFEYNRGIAQLQPKFAKSKYGTATTRKAAGSKHILFAQNAEREISVIEWRDMPYPWPLSDRWSLLMMEYILAQDDAGKPWLFTYVNDIDHVSLAL